MATTTDLTARLERTNRRLTLALVALGCAAGGAVLTGFAQPNQAASPEYVGIAIDASNSMLYRMRGDGELERLSLGRGRIPGGGTPAEWAAYPTGVRAP